MKKNQNVKRKRRSAFGELKKAHSRKLPQPSTVLMDCRFYLRNLWDDVLGGCPRTEVLKF
jgi:hypothetical protein